MAKQKEEATSVTTIEEGGALITSDFAAQLLADSGSGFEGVAQEDFQRPFIKLLQALSPQLKKSDPGYIAEAQAGDIIVTTSGEMFAGEDGLRVIAIGFNKKYLEYVPRKQGGGFVAVYDSKEEGQANMTDGNELVETANFFVLFESHDGMWKPAVISMSSSKLKASRAWLGLMRDQTVKVGEITKVVPMAGKVYRITAFEDKNRRNETYFNYRAEVEGYTPPEIYELAKSMMDTVEQPLDFSKASDEASAEPLPESNKKF